ncbi:Bacterial extracellular solute-binding protein [Clavibacter michiganensis]|uniref:Bacterial extracellular solute-binding protein n=1 Tax=Clavibacter michiganensis TaxID=28447 RepID=A0A251Y4J0_9MICO|nr:extracellular solute-binding protein [Clavibacter michiganensis]OUE18938.1 Bacterial extracellular solute-binding protein [Clavibacter michiganensis]
MRDIASPTTRRRRRPIRLALGAAVAAATVALTGCGAGADVGGAGVACDIPQPDAKTTVNVLSYNSPSTNPFTDAIATGCTGGNLTVNAPTTDFGGQNQRAVQSMSGANPSYDLVEVYGTVYPLYAERGWIDPLDDAIAEKGDELGIDDIDPTLLESLQYDGKQVGIPTFWGTIIFIYREDILSDLGIEVPTTFEEMYAAADRIRTETGMANPLALPFNAAGDNSSAYNQYLGSLGGTWFEDGSATPTLDTPESIAALDTLRATYQQMSSQSTSWSSPEVITQLQTGQAAMSMLFAGRVSALLDEGQTENFDDFAFAVPPAVQEGGTPATSLSVDGLSIAANSKVDKDLLFDLLGVATGADAATEAAKATIPARTTQAQAADLPFEEAARDVLESENPNGLPLVPYMSDVFAAMAPILAQVVDGTLSSADGATQLQAAAVQAIATAGFAP